MSCCAEDAEHLAEACLWGSEAGEEGDLQSLHLPLRKQWQQQTLRSSSGPGKELERLDCVMQLLIWNATVANTTAQEYFPFI